MDTQQEKTKEQERQELLKVKPDLGGFRNGVFIEPDPLEFADHTGYTSLFDGTTLTGWDGHVDVWRVKDGAIVGRDNIGAVSRHFSKHFSCLPWTEAKDFDLKLEIKVEKGGGSGIQYRSSTAYHAGMWRGRKWPA